VDDGQFIFIRRSRNHAKKCNIK